MKSYHHNKIYSAIVNIQKVVANLKLKSYNIEIKLLDTEATFL